MQIQLRLLALVLGLAAFSPGCASMIQAGCNSDQAYDTGANDAMAGRQMTSARWDVCDGTPERLAEIKASYRKGFESARNGGPSTININVGSSEPIECIERYGQKKCGYHCTEAFGQIACAQNPGESCIQAFGQIRCGKNCRAEYGQIRCD